MKVFLRNNILIFNKKNAPNSMKFRNTNQNLQETMNIEMRTKKIIIQNPSDLD